MLPRSRPAKWPHWAPVLALVALLILAAPAVAQQEEGDPNTVEQCEADHEGRELTEGGPVVGDVFQAMCPVTANLHMRGVFGAWSEVLMLFWLGLWVIPLVAWTGIVLWRVLPRRFMKVKAVRKVEEVHPGETASFALTVENRRKRRPVDVELSVTRPPKGWSASLAVEKPLPSGFKELLGEDEAMRVPLSARKVSANVADVRVLLRAPPGASEEDGCEVDLAVIPYLRDEPSLRRAKEARLVALVRPHEARPVIKHVHHEPQAFRVQDRITTTVHLENQGAGVLENLPVRLFVNGHEVASKDVRVPAKTETQVELPWNAPSDECRVRIVIGND
jgi:hypothetical protein